MSFDIDLATAGRMHSVVLTGLDYSMKPKLARYENSQGFIKRFPELKVMHAIKSLAIMVYNQEKMTPFLHSNVCDGKNSLAYFICAMHRQQAPQPMTKTHPRASSKASNKSNSKKGEASSASSCKLDTPGKFCDLPKLCTSTMLPLGYWDSLYYALVAEIRKVHEDLQNRFGWACELGNPILHYMGLDGTPGHPVTAIDLASLLETAWYALMDYRLVATLDDAVRMRNLRDNAAEEEVSLAVDQFLASIKDNKFGTTTTEEEDPFTWPPPIVDGLIDINALHPDDIVVRLWEIHAPEINRVCIEDSEDEDMLTVYRAEQHAKEVEATIAASTPLPSAGFCTCHRLCVCKFKCDFDSEECTCMNGRARLFHLIHKQEANKTEVYTKYVKPEETVPNQFLGAATSTLAQMQIAALANPSPEMVQACHDIHRANDYRETEVADKIRQRSNTEQSDLAYVPLSHPLRRGPKDAYPLKFYGDTSPHRYPKMSQQASMPPYGQQQYDSGVSFHHNSMPGRKPAPPPISTVNPSDLSKSVKAYRSEDFTPTPSAWFGSSTFTARPDVTYPTIPASQSQSMLTQSLPVAKARNPREKNYNFSNNDNVMASGGNDLANEYIGLLGRHPSTVEREADSRPALTTKPYSFIASPPKRAATTNNLPTFNAMTTSTEKDQPPLSEPDFIKPKPAVKQRYVAAGGNLKVSERPTIPGPEFMQSAIASGATISKEEVDAKMSDPEWVRANFGEAAVALSLTPPRPIDEKSKKNSMRSSTRKSDESDNGSGGDKRDRASSSASGTFNKVKRFFSPHRYENDE